MDAQSPLGQPVQRILEQHSNGLHKAELLKRMRQNNPFAQEQHLDDILAYPDTFAERPGQIWVLTRLLEAAQAVEPSAEIYEPPSHERDPRDELPQVPLPLDLSTYVVFDFETSGFDPSTESIIQFAAIRVHHSTPARGCQLADRLRMGHCEAVELAICTNEFSTYRPDLPVHLYPRHVCSICVGDSGRASERWTRQNMNRGRLYLQEHRREVE